MGTTAVADIAAIAFFFVVVQKFTNLLAGFIVKSRENISLYIRSLLV